MQGCPYCVNRMVRRYVNFSGDDSDNMTKGLVELGIAARTALAKQQQVMEMDTKRLNFHGFQNEDQTLGSSFKSLEAEISALQLDLGFWQQEAAGPTDPFQKTELGIACTPSATRSLVPGTSVAGTDSLTLWAALERKYDTLLKSLVNETVEDAMRLTACELWDEELSDWDTSIAEFEQSLDHQTWDAALSGKDGRRSAYSYDKEMQKHLPDCNSAPNGPSSRGGDALAKPISANERLLINLFSCPPLLPSRGSDALSEIVKLSCSSLSVSSEIQEACAEIWEILISLCGRHPKTCLNESFDANAAVLRSVVYNVLRSLQDICRKQILRQLRVSTDEVSGAKLFERLKFFCTFEDALAQQPEMSHFWKLAYWCYRCGSSDALRVLIQTLDGIAASDAARHISGDELRILILVAELLDKRLRGGSRAKHVDDDAVWQETPPQPTSRVHFSEDVGAVAQGHRVASASVETLFDFLHQHEELHSNPIVALLTSVLHPEGASVGLKTVMPNATAEDFLWYNLTLLEDKPPARLIQGISKLQKRIIQLGPAHFGSGGRGARPNLAFAKIACLALAPTTAIDWASQAFPELTVICLQWLVYLTQCDVAGSEATSLIPAMFPGLNDFLGTLSLSSAFEELLLPSGRLSVMNAGAALQWCELLPRSARVAVVSSVLQAGTRELLEDWEQRVWVLGSIEDDGSCRGGILYRCLMAPSWLDNPDDQETQRSHAALKAFETLTAGVAEAAAQQNRLLEAVALSYLISQDRAAMKFLIQLFASSKVFPHINTEASNPSQGTPTSTGKTIEEQAEVWKFFRIFRARLACGELQELASTFELLCWASKAAECYSDAYHGRLDECWKRLTQDTTSVMNTPTGRSLPISKSFGDEKNLSLFPDARLVASWKNTDLEVHLPRLVEVATLCLENLSKKRGSQISPKELRQRSAVLLNTAQELSDRDLVVVPRFIHILRSIVNMVRL